MFADLNLTPEQTKQLEEIRKNSGSDFNKMREETDKVLTTEQREKMQQKMNSMRQEMDKRRAEMDARLKKTLSEQDFAAFKKRMEEMRPPGGGTPPGEPPPGGGGGPPPSR
jgi:Spy/CpxP family protein refolding chaperone